MTQRLFVIKGKHSNSSGKWEKRWCIFEVMPDGYETPFDLGSVGKNGCGYFGLRREAKECLLASYPGIIQLNCGYALRDKPKATPTPDTSATIEISKVRILLMCNIKSWLSSALRQKEKADSSSIPSIKHDVAFDLYLHDRAIAQNAFMMASGLGIDLSDEFPEFACDYATSPATAEEPEQEPNDYEPLTGADADYISLCGTGSWEKEVYGVYEEPEQAESVAEPEPENPVYTAWHVLFSNNEKLEIDSTHSWKWVSRLVKWHLQDLVLPYSYHVPCASVLAISRDGREKFVKLFKAYPKYAQAREDW